ncbi:MAG TPA: glycosyltransferase family 2 protein [Gemmatimonadaceae bacterium]|jgi:dolichol-phosphate mannosyltransferase
MARAEPCTLDIVVPCFNEEAVIAQTHQRLAGVARGIAGARTTIIYVDDGSRDATLAKLREIAAQDAAVRIVALSRNFGHQYALTAGLDASRGDAVAVIDADLQDPPEVIPEMLARWRAGADVVYGVRSNRQGESAFKRGTAHVFYRFLQKLGNADIPADVGDFRLIDRRVVATLHEMPERDRFLRGLVVWAGFRQEGVSYERQARAAGETKFPFRRMFSFALDGIFSFSTVPLRMASYLGFFVSMLSMIGIVYAFYIKLFTVGVVPGWAAQWIGTLFLGGVQLLSLGVIGEYVGRIYGEVKRRPLYVVKERIGFDPQG